MLRKWFPTYVCMAFSYLELPSNLKCFHHAIFLGIAKFAQKKRNFETCTTFKKCTLSLRVDSILAVDKICNTGWAYQIIYSMWMWKNYYNHCQFQKIEIPRSYVRLVFHQFLKNANIWISRIMEFNEKILEFTKNIGEKIV